MPTRDGRYLFNRLGTLAARAVGGSASSRKGDLIMVPGRHPAFVRTATRARPSSRTFVHQHILVLRKETPFVSLAGGATRDRPSKTIAVEVGLAHGSTSPVAEGMVANRDVRCPAPPHRTVPLRVILCSQPWLAVRA